MFAIFIFHIVTVKLCVRVLYSKIYTFYSILVEFLGPAPKLKMSHQKKLIKCTIDHLQRLQEQSSAYVYSKDEYMVFRNYVLALIQIIVPSGTIKNIRHKIDYSRSCFRKSKRYRLATIIYESTRIIAIHHGVIFVGDIPDCLIEYSHPTFSSCITLFANLNTRFLKNILSLLVEQRSNSGLTPLLTIPLTTQLTTQRIVRSDWT